MAINEVFAPQPEQAIASYNYFDLAEGRGYKVFYGFNEKRTSTYRQFSGSTIISYGLTESTLYSNDVETSGSDTAVGIGPTNMLDINFDLTFNKPQIVDGPVRLMSSYAVRSTLNSLSGSLHYNIFKYNGTTETLLISGGTYYDVGNTIGLKSGTKTVILDVPRTSFKAGEILRINAEGWGVGSDGASTGIFVLAHDPKERTDGYVKNTSGTAANTIMEVHVPFKIDL